MTPAEARDQLDEARDHYEQFSALMADLGRSFIRKVDPNEYERVDAYPGWHFDRDMGTGMGPEQWVDEIEETIEKQRCDRCTEWMVTGQDRAEVASDDYDSVVIHASCMRPDEEVA